MRFFHEEDVLAHLSMEAAIECLRGAFAALARGEAQNQPRRRLMLPTGAVLHSLAGAYNGFFGTKVYSTHPRYGAHFTVLLFDAQTAKPVAQFEANHLGQIRTGAASGLAADLLAPAGPLSVGVIGSGFQAKTQLAAIRAVREVSVAKVWSRNERKRMSFAEEHSALATSSASAAVRDADVVITMTSSKDPVLKGADIRPEALVIAAGSNYPNRRELPSDLVRQSLVVVDDLEQCRMEAGDLLLALDESGWRSVRELKTIVTQTEKYGRADRPIIFKSVGLGLEDVAAAAYVYQKTIPEPMPADQNPARR